MTSTRESAPSSRRRALRDILLYGVCGGILIEIYGALVAALFAALGIWLGLTLTRKKPITINQGSPGATRSRTNGSKRA
jgi:hypothetical protein